MPVMAANGDLVVQMSDQSDPPTKLEARVGLSGGLSYEWRAEDHPGAEEATDRLLLVTASHALARELVSLPVRLPRDTEHEPLAVELRGLTQRGDALFHVSGMGLECVGTLRAADLGVDLPDDIDEQAPFVDMAVTAAAARLAAELIDAGFDSAALRRELRLAARLRACIAARTQMLAP